MNGRDFSTFSSRDYEIRSKYYKVIVFKTITYVKINCSDFALKGVVCILDWTFLCTRKGHFCRETSVCLAA